MSRQPTLFGGAGTQSLSAALAETVALLNEYGPRYDTWVISYSGGKDSTALVVVVVYAVRSGLVAPPRRGLGVRYLDTRMELPPLHAGAVTMIGALRGEGHDARVILPPLDDRILVYMLGRGVPPPGPRFRWCTDRVKVKPIQESVWGDALADGRAYLAPDGTRRIPHLDRVEADPEYAGAAKSLRDAKRVAKLTGDAAGVAVARDRLREIEDRQWRPAERVLGLVGIRVGESARRDQSIAAACSRDGAECGQGRVSLALTGNQTDDINRYFVRGRPAEPCDVLAPILHWRACNVWDFLECEGEAPEHGWHEYSSTVADAYGPEANRRDQAAARTGCVGCHVVQEDKALGRLLLRDEWSHLRPLGRLTGVYDALWLPGNRLRQPGGERKADGSLCANQNRPGPLTLDARRWALGEVLAIQAEVNAAADRLGRPGMTLLDAEEQSRIRELIAAGTWPEDWVGDEPRADEPFDQWHADGSVQRSLFTTGA